MVQKQALELYLHIPFCVRKCRYCDFLSMSAQEDVRRKYVDRLLEEIMVQSRQCKRYQVVSVFVGGGTPSLLAGVQVWEIMEAVRSHFCLKEDAEITLECNPETLTAEKLSFYQAAGINRLSLGLQSADNRELRELGRIHTFEDFLESFDLARKKGFHNINIDLISSLPGQLPQRWASTLKKVSGLLPEHISAYSLIVEEGTPFYELYGDDEQRRQRGEEPRFLPSEEAEREMYNMTREILAARGYRRYEISNYALPHRECRHNIGYWRLVPYLGLGLGSSSFIENVRYSNTGNLSAYLGGEFRRLTEILEYADQQCEDGHKCAAGKNQELLHQQEQTMYYLHKRQQMEEFMFLGMRMMEGVSRDKFRDKFGIALEGIYGSVLNKLQQQGLIEQWEGMVRLTEEGIAVSNYVFSQFLDDSYSR